MTSPSGLGRSAARGLLVASGGNFAAYVFSFGAAMVLARLLTPNDFGQVALAMAVADLLFIAIGLSLPTALLREPADAVELACRTSMTMMAIACCAAVAVGACITVGLSALMSTTVAALFAVIALARMPPLFGLCLAADIQRRNAYGTFSIVIYGSQAVALVVAVMLGVLGAGVWSLVAREAVASIVLFALAWKFSRWRIRFGFDRTKARELLRFGALMLGSRAGDIMFHRYDTLVVGALAGTRQLGLYNQSYVLAELSNRVYAPVIFTVPLNTYAQLQGDRARTTRMYQLTMFAVVRSVVPLGVVIFVFPGEVLATAFGSQWKPGADMLRALGVYTLLLPVFEHARALMIANGRVAVTLRARAAQLVVLVPAVPVLTLALGGAGAGLAVAAAMIVGTAWILRDARSMTDLRFGDFVAPIVAGVAGGAAGYVVASGISADVVRLIIGGGTMLGVYAIALAGLEGRRIIVNARLLRSYVSQAPDIEPDVAASVPTSLD